MTTKKFFLTATLVATVFAFTVPVSFAACPTGGACPVESVQKVTPDTATCSKCKQEKDKCKCKKAKKEVRPVRNRGSSTVRPLPKGNG